MPGRTIMMRFFSFHSVSQFHWTSFFYWHSVLTAMELLYLLVGLCLIPLLYWLCKQSAAQGPKPERVKEPTTTQTYTAHSQYDWTPSTRATIGNQRRISSGGQTTFQRSERLFGEFLCRKCNRKWSSGNSWDNTGQECQNCRIMVYPHHQRPLDSLAEEKYERDLTKPHITELCEKCRQLGRDCSRRWYGEQ